MFSEKKKVGFGVEKQKNLCLKIIATLINSVILGKSNNFTEPLFPNMYIRDKNNIVRIILSSLGCFIF